MTPVRLSAADRVSRALKGLSDQSSPAFQKSLKTLGVHPSDHKAVDTLLPLIKTIQTDPTVSIEYDPDSQIFCYLRENSDGSDTPIAYAKPGTMRSQVEPGIRQIAHMLGFEDYVPPTIPWVVTSNRVNDLGLNSLQANESLFTETTFSGHEVDIHPSQYSTRDFVCVLSPYVDTSQKHPNFDDFAMLSLFLSVVGARDVDNENVLIDQEGRPKLIDVEEFMAACPPSEGKPTLDVNYFNDYREWATKNWSNELFERLHQQVSSWKRKEVRAGLNRITHTFFDRELEGLTPRAKGHNRMQRLEDGTRVTVDKTSRQIEYFPPGTSRSQVFSREQIESCLRRIKKVQEVFEQVASWRKGVRAKKTHVMREICSQISAMSVAFAADPSLKGRFESSLVARKRCLSNSSAQTAASGELEEGLNGLRLDSSLDFFKGALVSAASNPEIEIPPSPTRGPRSLVSVSFSCDDDEVSNQPITPSRIVRSRSAPAHLVPLPVLQT